MLVINPRFGHSHVRFRGKIADILAAAGHEVVVYQPIFEGKINETGSKHPNIRYVFANHVMDETIMDDQDQIWEDDSALKMIRLSNAIAKSQKNHCSILLNDKQVLKNLKNENFDLGLGEIFDGCSFGIFEMIGLKKYVALHSGCMAPIYQSYLGIPKTFPFAPAKFSAYTDQMNFFERLGNFFAIQFENWSFKKIYTDGPEEAIKEVVAEFDMQKKIQEAAFLFVNSDEHVDFTMPITPKLIYTGGLGKSHSKPLAQKYIDIFNSAKKGVIYFSFGSVVKSKNMPKAMRGAILSAFSEFPDINFIWKYEDDTHQVAKDHSNVFTFRWLPQNEILEHPKTLAFISHGGMNSVIEGATKGVPMICIPFYADQNHNAMILERRGTAETILKNQVTKQTLVRTIRKIINVKKYNENAKLLSKMVKSKVMESEERIVKYSEFAAEFGDSGTLQTEVNIRKKM
uniref:UDP-glucuronosyltransferase n=1 Tax=Panagrolaimus sp. JU765 TaxID=591449 RepID=A0AC34QCW7_9BILA